MREGYAPLSDGNEPGNTVLLGSNREILVNCPRGARKDSSEKVIEPIAQLKCFHTNTQSMGNEQEALEVTVQVGM